MTIPCLRSRVLLLLAALIISACVPGATVPPATPTLHIITLTRGPTRTITATPTPPISVDPAALHGVNVQAWYAFSGSAETIFTEQVTQFNASNEWGIVIIPRGYGDYNTLYDAVNTAIDTGAAPDLVAALPEQALSWDASVADLTPYIGDANWGLDKAAIAAIPPVFWKQDVVNGKQWGVPAQRSGRFLYYNQTWARELGFNTPPATANGFKQQACAANASFRTNASPQDDGYGGWIVDTNWQTTYSWLVAFGGSVNDGNAYTFSTDPNLAALKFLKGLYDDNCAWIPIDSNAPQAVNPGPFFDQFARRLALFVSGDLAEVSLAKESMSRQNNADEWTLIPFPGSSGKAVVAYGPSYSVLKSTPERQLAAWLFARWLLSPQNQAGWVDATGLFPLGATDMTVAPSPQWQAAVADLSLVQGVPQLASWRKVRYVLEDGTNIIFQNNLPVDQIPSMLTLMDSTAKEISGK
jgi:multiple sugar transport system substrate-binding protein